MKEGQIRHFVPAALLFVASTVGLIVATMQAPVAPGEPVAILFPPGTALVDSVSAVGRAGGLVERAGRWDNIVIATFPDRAAPVDDLRATGALLVFNAIIAGGCDALPPTVAEKPSSRTKGIES